MQGSTTPARRRKPGFWLLIGAAAVTLMVLGISSSALATLTGNKLNQKVPIAVDAAKYQGREELCEGTPAGAAIWHFVLTKTTSSSATLEVSFAGAGTTQYASDLRTGGTLHWYITTSSPETLIGASTSARGNRLNLSEICNGGPAVAPTEEPSPTVGLDTDEPPTGDPPTADPPSADPTFDLETAGPVFP